MAGRPPPVVKFNPGVRSPEQQRRRGLHVQQEQQALQQKAPQRQQDQHVQQQPKHAAEVFRTKGAVVISEAAAQAVTERLALQSPGSFLVAKLSVRARDVRADSGRSVASRLLPVVLGDLRTYSAEGIAVGKVCDSSGGPADERAAWLGIVTTLGAEEAVRKLLGFCESALERRMGETYSRSDAWRFEWPHAFHKGATFAKGREGAMVVEGEPFALEVEFGPCGHIPDDLEEPKPVRACIRGFALPGSSADLPRAAQGREAGDLLAILERGLGALSARDSQGVTPLHLAALTGDAGVAEAFVARARESVPPEHRWRDRAGRTPLHYAAFFDSARLARAFLGLCEPSARDHWGRTALDLATGLGHHGTMTVLVAGPFDLQELCRQKVLKALRVGGEQARSALSSVQLPEGLLLADCVPLHEYGALQRLAAALPDTVATSKLLRSMSCMECWYADMLNCGCAPAVPGCMELLRVWEDLPAFRGGEAEHDGDGAVLASSPQRRTPPTVADRATFLERFHRRTGGIFQGMDWSNVLVIGGMVLACLTADDEEYARSYRETDVDIYVVGLSGKAFRQRVAEVASCLPRAACEDDRFERLEHPALLSVRPNARTDWLEVVAVRGTEADWKEWKRPPQRGDAILRVGYEDDPHRMAQLLQEKRAVDVFVRPCEAVAAGRHRPSATLLRTPQTLTACIRGESGRPLPNVQVVLAPYASPAHLLFTTDIDCTAMGFDGRHLLATPRAREAIRRRRNIARPEKYMVRGEWRTEARLLKYAMRGFRVVDLGLRPNAMAPADAKVSEAARVASTALQAQQSVEPYVRRVRDSGVHGARLLLLAARSADLRRLMLHEVPKIRAGMGRESLIDLVRASRMRRGGGGDDSDEQPEGAESNADSEDEERRHQQVGPAVNRDGNLEMDDGYGKATSTLLIVNPARLGGGRVQDGRLRGKELSLQCAITELDLEADRFEVRSWYEGMPGPQLQPGCWELEPAVWRGVGDFRAAA